MPFQKLTSVHHRLIAGGTLSAAGVAVAATLAFSGGAAAPAFAVTPGAGGSVDVTISQSESLPAANAKLASMGDPQITIHTAAGAAASAGAVTCTTAPGTSGPTVAVSLGDDGTETIGAGNTGAGTWHIASCEASSAPAGNTGS